MSLSEQRVSQHVANCAGRGTSFDSWDEDGDEERPSPYKNTYYT